eukprot:3201366-Rhodomonas_salina.2
MYASPSSNAAERSNAMLAELRSPGTNSTVVTRAPSTVQLLDSGGKEVVKTYSPADPFRNGFLMFKSII